MQYRVIATRFPLGISATGFTADMSKEAADLTNVFDGRHSNDSLYRHLQDGWKIKSFQIKDVPSESSMDIGDAIFFFLLEKEGMAAES